PAPDRTRAEGTGWRVPASVVIAAAVAIVVVASGAAVVWGRHRAGKPAGPSPAAAIGNRPICPAISSLPTADRSAAGEVLAGVGDDGCPIEVVWSGGEVTVRRPSAGGVEQPVKYQLGEPGDQAVLGDWDCDGSTTLGVYRPDTGAAFVFDGWPSPDQPVTARPVASGPAIRDGRAEVVHPGGAGSGRCDELVVRPR